jgi:hypothetical protein
MDFQKWWQNERKAFGLRSWIAGETVAKAAWDFQQERFRDFFAAAGFQDVDRLMEGTQADLRELGFRLAKHLAEKP